MWLPLVSSTVGVAVEIQKQVYKREVTGRRYPNVGPTAMPEDAVKPNHRHSCAFSRKDHAKREGERERETDTQIDRPTGRRQTR